MAFSLGLIIIFGLTADYIFRRMKLPGLVGMLLAGVIVGPYMLDIMAPQMMSVSADFRKIALIVILLRAGFELRRDTLNKVGRPALIMSVVPAIFEITGVVLVAPGLLGMSVTESLILGSILAAVSPAVVVPLMINFIDQGRGNKKGIPTLILGASSIDDVFVIVLFSVFLNIYKGGEVHLFSKLIAIPVSIILGIAIGLAAGYLLYHLFQKYDWRPPKRTMMVIGIAVLLTWFEEILAEWVSISGLLGIMAMGFIILEKSEAIAHIISQRLKKIWVFAELLLFVLVGAQVNIHVAYTAGLAGAVVIAVGLIFRSMGTYLSLLGTPFNYKERLFCVIAYIPKATVQAAIGAAPLAAGVGAGEIILAVAVLSIFITAPLGALGIMIMGEKILDYESESVYKFKDLREKLALPHVGQRVRNKSRNTVWKVIEEREIWSDSPIHSPGILLRFWSEETSQGRGRGKTLSHEYIPGDQSFQEQWEILYDW